ncbi:MFS transporter [Sphingomonas sp. KR1UV-12]|uniref:MFS transporter n=1 Tax=Sphingomonas aurea TaxID=3063994 RepID=A0ABT9EKT5_9SPHN|nr:MFS transporter [Sphingomonas sp. KR1UV-12]MDP1027566.1 MFS transporter [Sphingomonas sp. KR1UV-12]
MPDTAATPERPFTRSLGPLLILALAMLLGFAMMQSFGTVQEGAKAEMGLSDYTLSLIQGLSAALPLALFSIPIGILVDRHNRVRIMIALVATFVAGTWLTAFATGPWLLFVARMLAGVGTTGALTAALSLCADLCAPAQRGRALLIVGLGKSLGQAAAFGLVGLFFGWFVGNPGLLGGLAPWRGSHALLAAVGTVAMLPLFLLREPARHEVAASTHAPFRIIVAELWGRRGFLLPLFLGQVSVIMADAAGTIWAAPVLSRSFALQPQDFAAWMAPLMFIAGTAGAAVGGLSADLGQKSARRGGLLIGAIIAAAIGVPAALFPVAPSVPMFAIAFGTLILAGSLTGAVTSVALTVFIPNELRGLCIGAFLAVAGLIGFGLAPPLVAAVSGLLGGEQHLAGGLAIVGVATSIVSLIAFIVAMRRAPISATAEPI